MISLVAVCVFAAYTPTLAESRKEMEDKELHAGVQDALMRFKLKDSTFEKALDKAYADAIYPNITKGGLIVGGAGGVGEIAEKGKLIGRVTLSQGTIGAQIGGQVFSESIFFENEAALNRFKLSEVKMSERCCVSGQCMTA